MPWVRTLRIVGLAVVVGGSSPAASRGETLNCTPISSLPAVISSAGVYCLTGNLNIAMTSGVAVTINASNVTIDLNDFAISDYAAGPTTARGIVATNRSNITIRNGSIRYFHSGVELKDTSLGHTYGGHRLEDLRVEGYWEHGLYAFGRGSRIRNNQVIGGVGAEAVGIYAAFQGVQLSNNNVVGAAVGIRVYAADGCVVENNTIANTPITGLLAQYARSCLIRGNHIGNPPTASDVYGIYVAGEDFVVRDNSIGGVAIGIYFDPGSGSDGTYMGNVVVGAVQPYFGGTAAGTNWP